MIDNSIFSDLENLFKDNSEVLLRFLNKKAGTKYGDWEFNKAISQLFKEDDYYHSGTGIEIRMQYNEVLEVEVPGDLQEKIDNDLPDEVFSIKNDDRTKEFFRKVEETFRDDPRWHGTVWADARKIIEALS